MRLILIYGTAQDAILKKINQIKEEFDPLSITEINEKGDDLNLFSSSLFSEKRLLILNSPELKLLESLLSSDEQNLTVVIKFIKNLEKSSTILKKTIAIKGEIFNFNETSEVSIFPLLDMLGNKNKKAFVELEKNYSQFGGQYILTMFAYFLRRMILKPKSSSAFMQQKIESQKKNFSLEKIKNLYRDIVLVDFQVKQGLLEEKLVVTLLIQKILN